MRRQLLPRRVVVIGGARTPIGGFLGSLRATPPSKLAAAAAASAIKRSGLSPAEIQQCVVGQVLAAGQGRASHRLAMSLAGTGRFPHRADIFLFCVVFGIKKAREGGYRLGDGSLVDSVVFDALNGPNFQLIPGEEAEAAAVGHGISRADCDEYAVRSFKRAADAASKGFFGLEGLEPLAAAAAGAWLLLGELGSTPSAHGMGSSIFDPQEQQQLLQRRASAHPSGRQQLLQQRQRQQQQQTREQLQHDEEVRRISLDRVASARPIFRSDGVLTAANSCKLGDGAAALVLGEEGEARKRGLRPLARVLSFADAGGRDDGAPFTLPSEVAILRALRLAGLERAREFLLPVDLYEVHEAFAALPLLLMRRLDICASRVNVNGGAISLGHPFGMSGVRMVLSLAAALRARDLTFGCAVACNGADSATALVLEAL
ncbi:acetyil CoA acetyltransferase/thiolase, putative [Eimeria tenella]|uniref:Acetyil CoA acetyltransferase/thiolase, putative n=1 Tax=Eimeria tenella TaxID=5802 RepID=U6KJ58_EIMTE|nr:acetyil CoA acetyltransferase/thiolase, putative [Eimeria tenella]CDJ37954.1 acetyil CoA acetyltransferase/thiolase, putative [Eimeria tenella]|eukprot:XP_013228792.1 acetyil CoA acetyltransferase/thiolase, putative [Eimeria tenella]